MNDEPNVAVVQRFRSTGVEALSVPELLVLLLGLPRTTEGLQTAVALFAKGNDSLRRMATYPTAHFESRGISDGKLNVLKAALELGKRMLVEPHVPGQTIRSPKDIAAYYTPRIADLVVEEFHVAVLDSHHCLERDVVITRGILNSSLVHPREIFREAIAERAAAIVLVHNHPSGDPTPSPEDQLITQQLVSAGQLLDIPVYDHVIIGRDRFISFAEAGLL